MLQTMRILTRWLLPALACGLAGCFLIISHNAPGPTIISAHLLPPKLEKDLRLAKPLDASVALLPFEFDLGSAGRNLALYVDFSHIQREFNDNLAVIAEERLAKTIVFSEHAIAEPDEKVIAEHIRKSKADSGIWGKVRKIDIQKTGKAWRGVMEVDVAYVIGETSKLLKKETYRYRYDNLTLPDNMNMEYQIAMAASELVNNAYRDIVKDVISFADTINEYRSVRDVLKGKGIITFRRSGRLKGKAKCIIDIRMKLLLNDLGKSIIGTRKGQEEQVKKFVEDMKGENAYLLEIVLKDSSEKVFLFKNGKLAYDSSSGFYSMIFTGSREFVVNPGRALVVASFHVPKSKEVVSKGVYLDINPERGASAGLNLISDTKNNFVDMVFSR